MLRTQALEQTTRELAKRRCVMTTSAYRAAFDRRVSELCRQSQNRVGSPHSSSVSDHSDGQGKIENALQRVPTKTFEGCGPSVSAKAEVSASHQGRLGRDTGATPQSVSHQPSKSADVATSIKGVSR